MIEEVVPKEEARVALEPHFAAIQNIVSEGWMEWGRLAATNGSLLNAAKRTRASAVYDFVTDSLETYFEAQGVGTSRDRGYLEVHLLDGALALRFKKFRDKKMRTSGVPTAQRQEHLHQSVTLDGMHATQAVVGYLPDELGEDLQLVAVSCAYLGEPIWDFPLESIAATVSGLQQQEGQRVVVRSATASESSQREA